MKPAERNLPGVHCVAVLDLDGPADLADLARRTIASRLETEGGFTVVSSQELGRFARAPLYYENGRVNQTGAVEAAAQMGLDAVLVGQLARRQESKFGFANSNIQIGDPVVTVRIDFQLIDARTGNVLASGGPDRSYSGELDRYGSGSKSEQKVLGELVDACAHEVAGQIAPHRVPIQMQLAGAAFAKGATAIWAGNGLARKGEWQAARQHWNEALERNPESHAAAHNLGLAYEAMDDFAGASRMYALAAGLADKDLYNDALNRVERSGQEYELAMSQIDRRRRQLPTTPPYRLVGGPAGIGTTENAVTYPTLPVNPQLRRLPPE